MNNSFLGVAVHDHLNFISMCLSLPLHYLLHCNRYTVSRTTLLLGIEHILCPELNITLLRDLCPTHLSKIMTEGSDDLSVNINLKPFECVFQYIKSTKRFSR